MLPYLLHSRIRRLAQDIALDYKDEEFTILCLLDGAYRFSTVLFDEIAKFQQACDSGKSLQIGVYRPLRIMLEFVKIKRYIDSESNELKISGNEHLQALSGKVRLDVRIYAKA